MKHAPRPRAGQVVSSDNWTLDQSIIFADYDLEEIYGSFDTKELWDRSTVTNNSQHVYADINQTGVNPFVLDGEKLRIHGKKLEKEMWLSHFGRKYSSGHLSTFTMGPYMQWGRASVTVQCPAGDGLWPAFWMYPKSARFDKVDILPEIDVMERIGDDNGTYYANVHTYEGGFGLTENQFKHICPPDIDFTTQKHVFGVERMPEYIAFFLDNHYMKVMDHPVDPLLDGEWFAMLQLAIGGGWPGNVDEDFEEAFLDIWDLSFDAYIGPDLPSGTGATGVVTDSLLLELGIPENHGNIDVMRRLIRNANDYKNCADSVLRGHLLELM